MIVIPYGAFGGSFSNGNSAGALTLPSSVTTIGEDAFAGSGFTGALSIPNSVNIIGSGAFSYCEGFTGNLDLSNTGLTEITWGAFGGCTGLNGLVLPNGLLSIGESAFEGCSSIANAIVFQTTLTSIGARGFYGCTSIPAFGFNHTSVFPYAQNMFWKDSAGGSGSEFMTTPIYVGEPLVATYKTEAGWIDHKDHISKPPGQ